MASPDRYLIVGASLAGATAAETLRTEGFEGEITLVGDEPYRPYERPPLSKAYLQGEAERESAFVHPEGWYEEHDVDLRVSTKITSIDRGAREVSTGTGDRLGYDKLLLATGSTPRQLSVPGADLNGVLYLRRLEDSERMRDAFGTAKSVAIIGAGWIGLETAAAARKAGLQVTLLENAELPLLRILGRELAQVFADLHVSHGVDLRCGVSVERLTGDGSVNGVRLEDGSQIDADLVVVGVGITPNVGLAEDAGLEVDNGITVDEHLRTSDPAIFAAGDVANSYRPALGRHVRVDHWANAQRQGEIAGKTMLGQDAVDDRPPYFYSDQYDLGMEYTGYVEPDGYDEVVFRGDLESGEFIAYWLAERRVLAGMNVNTWDVAEQIEALVRSDRPVDIARLADPDVPMTDALS